MPNLTVLTGSNHIICECSRTLSKQVSPWIFCSFLFLNFWLTLCPCSETLFTNKYHLELYFPFSILVCSSCLVCQLLLKEIILVSSYLPTMFKKKGDRGATQYKLVISLINNEVETWITKALMMKWKGVNSTFICKHWYNWNFFMFSVFFFSLITLNIIKSVLGHGE